MNPDRGHSSPQASFKVTDTKNHDCMGGGGIWEEGGEKRNHAGGAEARPSAGRQRPSKVCCNYSTCKRFHVFTHRPGTDPAPFCSRGDAAANTAVTARDMTEGQRHSQKRPRDTPVSPLLATPLVPPQACPVLAPTSLQAQWVGSWAPSWPGSQGPRSLNTQQDLDHSQDPPMARHPSFPPNLPPSVGSSQPDRTAVPSPSVPSGQERPRVELRAGGEAKFLQKRPRDPARQHVSAARLHRCRDATKENGIFIIGFI